jgi:hypothetical protein
MNITIINRNYFGDSGFSLTPVPFGYEFEISESTYNLIIANIDQLKHKKLTTTKLINSEIYNYDNPFGTSWFCFKNTYFDNKFYIVLTGIEIIDSSDLSPIADINFEIEGFSLSFVGVKNFSEPTLQEIVITTENDFTIDAPVWLIVSPNSGTSGTHTLSIVPPPTNTMSIGNYSGDILVKEGTTTIETINVSYSLSEFIQSPYSYEGISFTLDKKEFEFESSDANSYLQTNAFVKIFDTLGAATLHIIPQKHLPFNNKCRFNLGKVIHNLMLSIQEPNEDIYQYRFAELELFCEERSLLNNTVIRTARSSIIKFLAGLSRDIETFGFLDFNMIGNRVTKNSYSIVNMVIPDGNYQLNIYKNNSSVPVSSILLPDPDNKVICKKISFSEFNPGDVIRIEIAHVTDPLVAPVYKKFYVLHEGKYSNHIIWQNIYKVQSSFEFTGGGKISTEFEQITQKLYDNFVERLETLGTYKEVKIMINTGWITKVDIDSIESLMRAEKAWLKQDGKVISLVPLVKSMANQDTERELVEYSIEFTINREHDEETYSF